MELTSTAALKVPPEMVTELALGMEDGVLIAQRHGFSAADFVALMGQPWFRKQIEAKQQDLEANGFTFRAKMALLAEDLLVDLWAAAKISESGSLKHDVAKLLAKLADLEPKNVANAPVGNGSGYQIIINIPDAAQAPSSSPVASDRDQLSNTPPVIDITPNKTHTPFIVPDFDLTNDLTNFPITPFDGFDGEEV